MSEMRRYLDSAGSPKLKGLLEAALDDSPRPGALGKVAAAVGVSTAALSALGSTSALGAQGAAASALKSGVASAGGAASAGGSMSVGSAVGAASAATGAASGAAAGAIGAGNTLAVLAKTLVVSMVSAGTLSAGVLAVQEPEVLTQVSAAPSASVSPAALVQRGALSGTRTYGDTLLDPSEPGLPETGLPETGHGRFADSSAPPTLPDDQASERAQPPAASESTTPPPAALAGSVPAGAKFSKSKVGAHAIAPHESALGREVKRIDSARQALESNDALRALNELESYERTRQSGVLDREALLLRIEALSRQQQPEQAKAFAREYLRRFPGDTHAARVRSLLSTGSSSVGAFPR